MRFRCLRQASGSPSTSASAEIRLRTVLLASAVTLALVASGAAESPWAADGGDGTYRNPVLYADYSDPDVVAVGDDYYLTASSFTNVPGLPILHSRDLVSWRLVGHALPRLVPEEHHATPRRGGGVWAPSLSHRDGRFLLYYPDPDFGIFVVSAEAPAGPWSEPTLVLPARGAIDPAPFWDREGQAWLVIGWARSRAGFANRLTAYRMNPEGTSVVDEGRVILDGAAMPPVATSVGLLPWITVEGPKIYERNGFVYIFAPAGGVKPGWQAVFRSRSILGPFEARNVLDQGGTDVNGPHQGAWVHTAAGQDYFLHFQDQDSLGRVVHLQPMRWVDDWPVIGDDADGDGRGEPVLAAALPLGTRISGADALEGSDEFDGPSLSRMWQWHANPREGWATLDASPGSLRLASVSTSANLWEVPSLLTQKVVGPGFVATTRIRFSPVAAGEQAGLVVFGSDYAWVGLRKTASGLRLVQITRREASSGKAEEESGGVDLSASDVLLRVEATAITVPAKGPAGAAPWPSWKRETHLRCRFSYSIDGKTFLPLGSEFESRPGRWVGTQVGLFAQAPTGTPSNVATTVGHADFDWYRVVP